MRCVWPPDGVRTEFPEAVVFFPLWPKLLGWLSSSLRPHLLARDYVGLVLANVLALVALWLLYKLVAERFGARRPVVGVFPGVQPVLGHLRRRVPRGAVRAVDAGGVPAGAARTLGCWPSVLGAVATLTRPNGVLIVIVFAVALVHRFGWRDLVTRHELGTSSRSSARPRWVAARAAGLRGLPVGAGGTPAAPSPAGGARTGAAARPGRGNRSYQAVRNVIRSNSPTNDTDSLWELLCLVLPLLARADVEAAADGLPAVLASRSSC